MFAPVLFQHKPETISCADVLVMGVFYSPYTNAYEFFVRIGRTTSLNFLDLVTFYTSLAHIVFRKTALCQQGFQLQIMLSFDGVEIDEDASHPPLYTYKQCFVPLIVDLPRKYLAISCCPRCFNKPD